MTRQGNVRRQKQHVGHWRWQSLQLVVQGAEEMARDGAPPVPETLASETAEPRGPEPRMM